MSRHVSDIIVTKRYTLSRNDRWTLQILLCILRNRWGCTPKKWYFPHLSTLQRWAIYRTSIYLSVYRSEPCLLVSLCILTTPDDGRTTLRDVRTYMLVRTCILSRLSAIVAVQHAQYQATPLHPGSVCVPTTGITSSYPPQTSVHVWCITRYAHRLQGMYVCRLLHIGCIRMYIDNSRGYLQLGPKRAAHSDTVQVHWARRGSR
jgi:hypothetical protein